MKKGVVFAAITVMVFLFAGQTFAHYGMVIPSNSMVMQNDSKTVTLNLSFSHPFEGVGMELAKPKVFGVVANGKKLDLLESLKKVRVMGHSAW